MRKRRWLAGAVGALLVALLMLGPGEARGAGDAFVYRDPVLASRFADGGRFGVMDGDGAVLVPAQYGSGYPLAGEDGRVRYFGFHTQTILRGGTVSYEGSALYDKRGKLLSEGKYDLYAYLAGGNVAASRAEGDNYVVDILNERGDVVEASAANMVVAAQGGGFFFCSFLPDGRWRVQFRDGSLATLREATLYDFSPHQIYEGAPGLYPFRTEAGAAKGFLDGRGDVVIEPAFADAYAFTAAGLAPVMDEGGRFGVIDAAGNAVLPCAYDDAPSVEAFIVAISGGEPVLFTLEGRALTKPGDYDMFFVSAHGDSFPAASGRRKDGTFDVFGQDGALLLEGESLMNDAPANGRVIRTELREGRWMAGAICDLGTGISHPIDGMYAYAVEEDRLFVVNAYDVALVDGQGREILRAEQIFPAGEGRYIVKESRFGVLMSGVIDGDGREILPLEFLSIGLSQGGGCYAVRRGNELGYIDEGGAWMYRTSAFTRLED